MLVEDGDDADADDDDDAVVGVVGVVVVVVVVAVGVIRLSISKLRFVDSETKSILNIRRSEASLNPCWFGFG